MSQPCEPLMILWVSWIEAPSVVGVRRRIAGCQTATRGPRHLGRWDKMRIPPPSHAVKNGKKLNDHCPGHQFGNESLFVTGKTPSNY